MHISHAESVDIQAYKITYFRQKKIVRMHKFQGVEDGGGGFLFFTDPKCL